MKNNKKRTKKDVKKEVDYWKNKGVPTIVVEKDDPISMEEAGINFIKKKHGVTREEIGLYYVKLSDDL